MIPSGFCLCRGDREGKSSVLRMAYRRMLGVPGAPIYRGMRLGPRRSGPFFEGIVRGRVVKNACPHRPAKKVMPVAQITI